MRRERPGFRGAHLVSCLLLLVPPAIRIALDYHRASVPGDLPPDAVASIERDTAIERLERMEELGRISAAHSSPPLIDPERYRIVPADVIPLSDPSGQRSVLWAAVTGSQRTVAAGKELEGPGSGAHGAGNDGGAGGPGGAEWEVPGDSAAIRHGALAGRVIRTYPRLRLARVQTLLDPGFRVRFSSTGPSGTLCGMLRGTGKADDGYPLLEVQYLSGEPQLAQGDPIYTEGLDGVYPPAVLIGRTFKPIIKLAGRSEDRPVVRAALRVGELSRLELLVDRRRGDAVKTMAEEAKRP